MPNKCGVVNCKGNYNEANKCRVFRLPKEEGERLKWLNAIPLRKDFQIEPTKFYICEKHWPTDSSMIKVPGGHTRPAHAPSIFDVPISCLPSPKPNPRQAKKEDIQLSYFLKKDKIVSFSEFTPEKEVHKKYPNVITTRFDDKLICVFMTPDYKESYLSVIVANKPTLCSPLSLSAYKNGISVSLSKILNPNNGLASYTQFFECLNHAHHHVPSINSVVDKAVIALENVDSDLLQDDKGQKLKFITRQLHLLFHKEFSGADYCLAIESYPHCSYDRLRELLVLPGKRKIQSIISSANINIVLEKTLKKISCEQQKFCFLLIDEVKIRPTVAFSNGVLNGMAKNDPESKASSMLCIMMKCLHGGPSVMISVTPVHKLTASYQFAIVKVAAGWIEDTGGHVIGSITDNHKINQQYCKLFEKTSHDFQGIHPLDNQRVWFLLFDTVHLLKCIRNNWISEKLQKLSFDNDTVGSFSDVKDLYESEKNNVLKMTPLNYSSVSPSRLQLQNVKHVLRVVNDKVVAALKVKGATQTAAFIDQILTWWKIVNVGAKGQDVGLRDPNRSVQVKGSTSLHACLEMFRNMNSGHGENRVQSLTHDTRKALIQTTEGLVAVCDYLFTVGFDYVLLKEIQSDRIEGEFSVYRQSTGGNPFMAVGDVLRIFKKRLARFSATFLQSIDDSPADNNHTCVGPIVSEDAFSIEKCVKETQLSDEEESASAYVAGWIEFKCAGELIFHEDESLVSDDASYFIGEVSRGCLTIPHLSTFELVRAGVCFVKTSKHRACCCKRLMNILSIMDHFYGLGLSSDSLFRRLANVLLNGYQSLEKDHEKNASLYQTSLKKARLAE